ncbi:MAG: GAF domain-containing protein [Gammaproteobacteria bacterium]|nr:GAF domain-containing protein [Gammaproteobacteria bacterium]
MLCKQLQSLIADEPDHISVLSNTSALINQTLSDINWVGFYLAKSTAPSKLLLGPFQGNVACYSIPIGKGVCGIAADTLTTQRIDDVHQFVGHIACDSRSQSEIVIPLIVNNQLYGVLDIDSPNIARFSENDQQGLESLAKILELCLSKCD